MCSGASAISAAHEQRPASARRDGDRPKLIGRICAGILAAVACDQRQLAPCGDATSSSPTASAARAPSTARRRGPALAEVVEIAPKRRARELRAELGAGLDVAPARDRRAARQIEAKGAGPGEGGGAEVLPLGSEDVEPAREDGEAAEGEG